jgi:hypothetical protein
MNNWCICWFSRIFLLGILIFKGLTALRVYKSFGVKGLTEAARFTLTEAAPTSLCCKESSLKGSFSLRERILISPNIGMRCELRHVWIMEGMSS